MARVNLPMRLGELKGWPLVAYRIVQPVLLAIGALVIVLGYRGEIDGQANARAFYALDLINPRYTGEGAMVLGFVGPMKRVISGEELLLAVDGRAIPTDTNAQTGVLSGPPGSVARLDLQRADGTRHQALVRRSPSYLVDAYRGSGLTFASRRWWQYASAAFAQLLALVTSLLLLLRRPRDPVAAMLALGQSASVVGTASAVWTDMPLLLSTTLLTGSFTMMLVALVFFPDGRLRSRWSWAVIALALAAGLTAIASVWWAALDSPSTALGYASLPAVVAAVIARYRATPAGIARQQMKFAILGFVVGLSLVTISTVLGQTYPYALSPRMQVWMIVAANLLSALGWTALLAGLLVSLLRYRLYDADTVISRSAAYAALTLLLGAAFAGSEKVIEVIGEEWFGEGSKALAAGAAAAIAAMLIAPLHGRIHHFAEQRFQRALAAVRNALPRRVADMREYAALDDLMTTVIAELEAGVRADRAAILLADGAGGPTLARTHGVAVEEARDWAQRWRPADQPLARESGDPLFPLRLRLRADGTGTVGWLALGPRPDGTFYSSDEREAIAALADPLARAIHVIQHRDQRTSVLTARIESLEREVARLGTPAPA